MAPPNLSPSEIEAALARLPGSNAHNRVTVDLSTHDAGGVTAKDVELAAGLEEIARKLQ